MRPHYALFAAVAALSLAACESQADKTAEKQSDAIEAAAENKADAIENQADVAETAGNEAAADAMDNQAEAVREAGEAKADAVEQAAGKKD